jgi:hypothetical protein
MALERYTREEIAALKRVGLVDLLRLLPAFALDSGE